MSHLESLLHVNGFALAIKPSASRTKEKYLSSVLNEYLYRFELFAKEDLYALSMGMCCGDKQWERKEVEQKLCSGRCRWYPWPRAV